MKENGEERPSIITLIDEDGGEHEFEVLDVFPVDAKRYAILVPVEDNHAGAGERGDEEEADAEEYERAYIFRIEEVEGEESLVEVEEEEEWNRVAREWELRMQELEEDGE